MIAREGVEGGEMNQNSMTYSSYSSYGASGQSYNMGSNSGSMNYAALVRNAP